jgi:hypothetical protein
MTNSPMEAPRHWTAALVLGADGSRSHIRQQLIPDPSHIQNTKTCCVLRKHTAEQRAAGSISRVAPPLANNGEGGSAFGPEHYISRWTGSHGTGGMSLFQPGCIHTLIFLLTTCIWASCSARVCCDFGIRLSAAWSRCKAAF